MHVSGQKIRELRKLSGLTQSELAKRLGVTSTTVTSFESGKRSPSLKTIIKMAQIFRVSVDCLLGFSDSDATVDVSGLTRKQQDIIHDMTLTFRQYNQMYEDATDQTKEKFEPAGLPDSFS